MEIQFVLKNTGIPFFVHVACQSMASCLHVQNVKNGSILAVNRSQYSFMVKIFYTDIFASKIISCILKISIIWKCYDPEIDCNVSYFKNWDK